MSTYDARRLQAGDLTEAIGLLTRLPVPATGMRGAKAAWAYPLAGALVALIAGLAGWLAGALGLPPGLIAAIALTTMVMLTGALHEDGLADCADGFWGALDTKRRLEIMKDSGIGTYGVVALVLSLLARWSALVVLIEAGGLVSGLIVAAALSRVPVVATMFWLDPARPGGLAGRVGRPDRETVILCAVAALLIAVLLAGFLALPAALVAVGFGFGVALIARARIGGHTGDVLGAVQQIAEIAVLATLVAGAT